METNGGELSQVKLLLVQKDNTINALKERARQFVTDMRAENTKLKQQVLHLQEIQQEKDQQIYQYKQEKQLHQQHSTAVAAAGDTTTNTTNTTNTTTTTTTTEAVTRLTLQVTQLKQEKNALASDVEDSKREWSVERSKAQQLEQDLQQVLHSQQQSTEMMAIANGQNRECQIKLDQALEEIQAQTQLIDQFKRQADTQTETAQEARHELDRVTNQTNLQMGASQQVLKDLRTHVTTVEQERDALVTALNEVRVSTKDGHLKLEAQVREQALQYKELEKVLSHEKKTFKDRRETAKMKFTELMERVQSSEAEATSAKRLHVQVNEEKHAIALLQQKSNIDLKSTRNELALLLHEKQTHTNAHNDNHARLVDTLEKTETELQDQRAKRIAAKNEILSMVRQLDGQRDVMTELFSQLQQLITRVGTYVITCRGAESKCNDTLGVLDVDMEIEVVVEGSGGSSNVRVSSQEESGETKKRKKRKKKRSKAPRNPTDLVDVLEGELNVLGSIVDDVSTKVELLTNHCRHRGKGSGGNEGGGVLNGGSNDSCVGCVKRLLGIGSNQQRTTVQRISLNGKRRKNIKKYGKLGVENDEDEREGWGGEGKGGGEQ